MSRDWGRPSGLSPKQADILRFMKAHHAKTGHVPGIRMVCDALSRPYGNVQATMKLLERRGFLVGNGRGKASSLVAGPERNEFPT